MAILDDMGKESNFLHPWYAKLSFPREKDSCFLPRSTSFPSFSQKFSIPFPTNPLQSICREGFFTLQKDPPPPINPSLKTLYYIFIFQFIFIYLFFYLFFFFNFYFFNWFPLKFIFFLSFFPAKLGILPQSGRIIPRRLGRIME